MAISQVISQVPIFLIKAPLPPPLAGPVGEVVMAVVSSIFPLIKDQKTDQEAPVVSMQIMERLDKVKTLV